MPGVSPCVRQFSRRCRRLLFMAGLGVAAYGLVAPLLAITHEVIVLAVAHLVGDTATFLSRTGALRSLPLDPIYTGAMVLTLGGIEPRGLALAGPVGEALHAAWPTVFDAPSLVSPHAWASAIVAPGATIVSRWLSSLVADAALLSVGILVVRLGRPGRGWLTVVGAIIQAHVVVTHLINVPPELVEIEAAGVPFAIAMIVSGDVQSGPRLAESLAGLDEPLRDALLGLGMVALAYVPVLGGLLLWRIAADLRRQRLPLAGWSPFTSRVLPSLRHAHWLSDRVQGAGQLAPSLGRLIVTGSFALAVALSPVGDLADAQTHFLASSMDEADPPRTEPSSTPGAAIVDFAASAPPPALSSSPVADGPSVVAVTGSSYRFQYVVNGRPRVIRGVGYNVRYRYLSPDERLRRLDRDFARLRAAGVTTVFGWERAEFDGVLLDAAQRHGLGVAPPFDLDPDADYANPEVRAHVTDNVLAWVAAYKNHPAVRMWAIGNEVLHKLVYPSWMPLKSDPTWEQRARDFATFYVGLVDRVRAEDPNHPIVHRDAEDAYLTWLRDEMLKGERRPWFIYGVNTYTPRLTEILANWPSQGWDVPLLVSEFAPGGMSPADRPQGFRKMWKTIRSANEWVLGGAVYAWTTDGPEEVDRVFGLVDEQGDPVDGAFSAIGTFYQGLARQTETERSRPDEPRDERIWAYARAAITSITAGHATDLLPANVDTSIMGDLNSLPLLAVADADLTVERVRDPRRVSWARDSGIIGEWWVTWLVPDRPNQKLTFVVNEREGGTLGVRYIYHGPR